MAVAGGTAAVTQADGTLDLRLMMAPDWANAMQPVADDIARSLSIYETQDEVLPTKEDVLRAFRTPMRDIRVIIVGQDPYPTPGHAMGLAFSVPMDVRPLPRTLRNILGELHRDIGTPEPVGGDLSPWQSQGVMLLNRVLTVASGCAGSHVGLGWEKVTEHAVRVLASRGGPLVAVLWGRHAQTLLPHLSGVPTVLGAHPSPLSASRGFNGSRPFSAINSLLREQGTDGVNWAL
jgi:uracil-DNA glycosylase